MTPADAGTRRRGWSRSSESLVEGVEEEVGVVVPEDQGWPDLEHVSGWAGRVEQYPALAHCLGHLAGLLSRWRACFIDQFDAEQEAFAPDITDEGVVCG